MCSSDLARHEITNVPATKMTRSIAAVLKAEGFIGEYEDSGEGILTNIAITIKYKGRNRSKPLITNLKRVSRPGLRVYSNCKELPKVLGGIGVAVISTSTGLMTDRQARRAGVGGEVLCYVW